MYFELNVPEKAPTYMHTELALRYGPVIRNLKTRFEKLNTALGMSHLDAPTFAALAQTVFKNSSARFDTMTAADLTTVIELLDTGERFEARLEWPNCEVVVDTAFTTNAEWEMLRCLGVGGSDASVIFGLSPFMTERRLYHEKLGTPLAESSERENIFLRGHFMEDRVIDAFCTATGAKRIPETRMFRSKTHPHVTANVDSFIRFPNGKIFIYEAKSTITENIFSWVQDKIPPYYMTQMRQYPAVMNDPRICGTYIGAIFCSDVTVAGQYVGSIEHEDKFCSRLLERDTDAELAALDTVEAWWNIHVECENEPLPSGDAKKDTADIAALSGKAVRNTHPVLLDEPGFKSAAEQYLKLKRERKETEKKVDALKELETQATLSLIEALGSNESGYIEIDTDTVYEVSYGARSREKVDAKTLKELFHEAAAACVSRGNEWRVFDIRQRSKRSVI